MQRYRVNYALLIGLVVGFFVTGGASYGLWRYQVDRNASRLLAKADAADAEGNVEEAYKSLDQYVQLRNKETEARRRLGEASAKVANLEEVDDETRIKAYQNLMLAVQETDDAKLRRDLVDLQVKFHALDYALININQLLDAGKGDSELRALKAQCLFATQKTAEARKWCFQMVGYDEKSDSFDPAKAEAPDKPVIYATLAQYLRTSKEPERASRVMEQMIAANPESREAYILQYQFLRSSGEADKAREALAKAFELDPTDASVLSAKGMEALSDYQQAMGEAQGAEAEEKQKLADEHLQEAARLFSEALERYPDAIGFYEQAAKIDLARKNPEQAFAVLDKGLARFPLKDWARRNDAPPAIALVNLKIDLLLEQKNFDAAKEQIKLLKDLNNPRVAAIADYHEARLLAINEKWAEAASRLREVKTRLLGFPDLQAVASAVQGFCHLQLGQFDLALEASNWALDKNPNLPQAIALRNDMQARLNPDEKDDAAVALDQVIRGMLEKPKAEQDWDSVTAKIDEFLEQQGQSRPANWVESRKALMRGQMFVMRAVATEDKAEQQQLFGEARNALKKAYAIDPKDPTTIIAIIRLLAQEPENGPARALERLDAMVKKEDDSAAFRTVRVDLLFTLHGENLLEQLNQATQGMDNWPANQQAQVWSTVGARFEQLGKFADAQRCLEKAIELAPGSLPTRNALFDLALRQGDDAAMRKAQESVLEIVKSQTDPTYVLTEVKRRIVGQATGAATADELREARTMLADAIQKRPKYSDLYIASGQLYILENNVDQALASFEKAVQLGATNLNAILMQVRLLADRGRMTEAREQMKRIPEDAWPSLLDRTAATVLLAVGEPDKALAVAEKIATAKADDAPVQVWAAEVASQAKKPEVAEKALNKAIEINPGDPDVWARLVSLYAQLKRPEDVFRVMREAHLALDEEFLPLLTARYYEIQGRWQEAEDIYLAAYSDKPDDVFVSRRMAEFYLNWSSQNEANRGKAAGYLNRILRAANEGKLAEGDANGQWARRQAARLLSTSGDYQNSLKAERLLSSAVKGGVATPEDEDQLVDVLSLRPDPVSLERVVDLLRKMNDERGGLSVARELHLGDALFKLGQWDACKEQMLGAIGRYPNDVGLKTGLISMLIAHKEFNDAQLWISRLDGVEGTEAPLRELRLRLAAAQDNKEQVHSMLVAMTPNLRTLSEQQVQYLRSVSQLADSVGDHQYALELLREYARRAPGSELDLARLTALYGDLDEGMALLKQQFDGRIDDVLAAAVGILRERRSAAPEKLDEEVSRLVRAGLRDDPESARRLVLEAEMLEVQGHFDESMAAYRKLLQRDDVPKLVRATAANNLAFLVALKGGSDEDLQFALNSVNDSIEVIGPLSDILDTRALVYIALGKYAEAADDMKLSVKVNPTPSKWYHLAAAQLGAGDQQAAIEAWKRARADGIALDKGSELERGDLQEFMKKMDALGATAQL